VKPRKERLDVLVVERGLAESRTKAQALILAGQVVVAGPAEVVLTEEHLARFGDRLPQEIRSRLEQLKSELG